MAYNLPLKTCRVKRSIFYAVKVSWFPVYACHKVELLSYAFCFAYGLCKEVMGQVYSQTCNKKKGLNWFRKGGYCIQNEITRKFCIPCRSRHLNIEGVDFQPP